MPIAIGALLEKIADEMLEGLQVIGKDWTYLYVNETVARQGKRSKDALIGRTMMECYPGIERTPLFERLKKCMEERVSVGMENEFEYPDGSKGWFQLLIHPVFEGLMILSIDISDRKRVEQELREKLDELDRFARLVTGREERMRELKATISRLKELMPELSHVRASKPPDRT
jgi:hypothetical protein